MLGATASRGRGRLISRPGTCTSCKERTFLTEANEGVPDSGNTTSRKHPPSLSSFHSVKLILGQRGPHGLFLQKLTKATKGFPTPATQPAESIPFVIFVPFCKIIFARRKSLL